MSTKIHKSAWLPEAVRKARPINKSWKPKGVQDPFGGAFTKSKLFEENSETPFASLTQLAVAVIVQIIVNGTAGTLLRIRQG